VASARQSIADLPHEIILVDDQSLDECCHGMPRDVLVVRSERRKGVSAARRLGFTQSRGDVILWSDPHCRFPAGCLKHLAQVAHQSKAIVQPKTFPNPNSRSRFGGKLVLSEHGLRIARAYRQPANVPALIGTVYAVQRSFCLRLGG